MKGVLLILGVLICVIVLFGGTSQVARQACAQETKKPPEVIVLAKEAKLGTVTFNHLKHITENRSPDGKSQIACVECHHTAQPLADAMKHPPHKTVWPADRTTTLTLELLEKDPNAVGAICTDCHARAETKPKLLPELPTVKFEGSDEPTVMTNQQAFHHNCGGCHDAVAKARTESTAPTSKKCVACHKKVAA